MVSPCTTIEKPTTAKVTTTVSSHKGSVDGRGRQSETKRAAHANFAGAVVKNQVVLCGSGCPVRFRLTAGQAGDAPQAAPLMDGLPAKVVMATRLMAHNA